MWAAVFDPRLCVQSVQPKERSDYISAASDALIRRQRYAVWMLLDCALRERTGKGVDGWHFKCEDGKWSAVDAQVCFSLSHSGNAVAVAVADSPVGVDIQNIDAFANCDKLERRVLSAEEREQFVTLSKNARQMRLAELWSCKESAFKMTGGNVFVPSETAVDCAYCRIETLAHNDYALAVACRKD